MKKKEVPVSSKNMSSREKLRLKKPKVLNKILAHEFDPIPRLQYQALYECNMKCSFCSVDNLKDKDREPMNDAQIKDLFDQADKMGISRISISGGEPLILGNQLDKLVEIIDASRFWLQLDSNSLLLTKEKVEHLKKIGIDCIAPSLDSLDKSVHDNVRNTPGSADKVLKSFDYIQDAELATFVQTIVGKTRLYSKEFMDFIEYFNGRDIAVYIGFCKPVGAFENHLEELLETEDFKYLENLEKTYKVMSHLTPGHGVNLERNCVASRNIFTVNCYGDTFPCIFYFANMGNVMEESLKDIHARCLKLKPFQAQTCVMADKDHGFIEKHLIPKIYGKKQPVPWQEIFTKEDFDD